MFELRRINGYSIVAQKCAASGWVVLAATSTRSGIAYVVARMRGVDSSHFATAGSPVIDLATAVAEYDAAT